MLHFFGRYILRNDDLAVLKSLLRDVKDQEREAKRRHDDLRTERVSIEMAIAIVQERGNKSG